ncbi:MAG: hypothetical protein ABH967_00010 [Patescibacteria group bacterium]
MWVQNSSLNKNGEERRICITLIAHQILVASSSDVKMEIKKKLSFIWWLVKNIGLLYDMHSSRYNGIYLPAWWDVNFRDLAKMLGARDAVISGRIKLNEQIVQIGGH